MNRREDRGDPPISLRRLHRLLIRVAPHRFRAEHAHEVDRTFSELERDVYRAGGYPKLLLFWSGELLDLASALLRLHVNERRLRFSQPDDPATGYTHKHTRQGTMAALISDLRRALRIVRRGPGFVVAAVLILGIGIGATTGAFSVVQAVILSPLPYPDAHRLVMAWRTLPQFGWNRAPVSYPNFRDWRERTRTMEAMAAYAGWFPQTIAGPDGPEQVQGALATPDLFRLLGARPLLGSVFESDTGDDRFVLLSHGLWTRRFGADSSIVGRPIRLGEESYTVTGVMPPDFAFPNEEYELWLPARSVAAAEERGSNYLQVMGLLSPGSSIEDAQAELETIVAQLAEAYPETNGGLGGGGVWLEARHAFVVRNVKTVLWVVLAVVALVLLIACANLAGLSLTRSVARHRELAVRAALGAGRARLVRERLLESGWLAVMGGGLGAALSFGLVRLFIVFAPPEVPRLGEVAVDPPALAFTAAVALACGLLFGSLPALVSSRIDLQGALREGGRSASLGRGRHKLIRWLVASQVAVACTLSIGAGLLANSLVRLMSEDPGFDARNRLVAQISLPESRYPEPAQVQAFFESLLARAEALPGVETAGMTFSIPLGTAYASGTYTVEGQPWPAGEEPLIGLNPIRGDYFRTVGIGLIRGRGFTSEDRGDAVPVAVVNATMANRHWPGEDPTGRRFKRGAADSDSPWITVVGVVEDVKREGPGSEVNAEAYLPHGQAAWASSMFVVLKGARDVEPLVRPLREAVWESDPALPVTNVRALEELLHESLAEPRFRALLLGTFAAAALLLSAIGVYGVLAFSVATRAREIGLRMALGAERSRVLGAVVLSGLRLAAIGVAAGLLFAAAAARVLDSMLFEIEPLDIPTYAAVALTVAVVAALASYFPAVRASRVAPIEALREE